MLSAERLTQVGCGLVKRCGTRDPFEIAKSIGVEVMYCDDFGPLKGMYRVIKRNRFVFINRDLPEQMQRIVCAHELGHDQLHRNLAKDTPLREFITYFQPDSRKAGGAYVDAAGLVKKVDEYERLILFRDGKKIPIDNVLDISMIN